jgi:hypothetical protein
MMSSLRSFPLAVEDSMYFRETCPNVLIRNLQVSLYPFP